MALENRLEELRKAAGLTQEELATKIGSSQKTISSWETGRTYPRMRDMNALCEALSCTLESLTGSKTRDIGDITFDDLLLKLRDLNINELEKLREVLDEIISNKVRLADIQKMKKEQEIILAEYARKIKELESLVGKGSDKP